MPTQQQRITGAHLRVQREHLGLARTQLAAIWNMNPGTLAAWEDGRDPTPYNLGDRLDELLKTTDEHLKTLAHKHNPGDTILTYRTDADYHQHNPAGPYTASWHRSLCARLLTQIPTLTIQFHQCTTKPAETSSTSPSCIESSG